MKSVRYTLSKLAEKIVDALQSEEVIIQDYQHMQDVIFRVLCDFWKV